MPYIPGDFWRICDRCGGKFRQSETRKTWDGFWVCLSDWEPRHPQDFVKGKTDKQSVPEPRPEPADVFISDECAFPDGYSEVTSLGNRLTSGDGSYVLSNGCRIYAID